MHPGYAVVSTPLSYGHCSEDNDDSDVEPCWFPLDQLEVPEKQNTYDPVQDIEDDS